MARKGKGSWKLRLFCPTDASGIAVLEPAAVPKALATLHARLGERLRAAGFALLPFLLPYQRAAKLYGFTRGIEETRDFSAQPHDWLNLTRLFQQTLLEQSSDTRVKPSLTTTKRS